MIETSEQVDALFAALAKAQAEMQNAERTAKNSHTKSQYTTLAAALDAVRPALTANDLCITQWPGIEDDRVTVLTRIAHSSGQWMHGTIAARLDTQRNPVQAVGSTITYLRRYALMSVVGIAPEDDDGNAASGRPNRREAPDERKARQGGHAPDWEAGKARFFAELGNVGISYDDLCMFLHQRGRARPSTLNATDRRKLLEWLGNGGADKVKADGGGK